MERSMLTSLDFIDNEDDVVLGGDISKALEKCWGRVVVAALGLDWLDNQGSHRAVPIHMGSVNLP